MKEKKVIHNSIFTIGAFFLSFIGGFFRSFGALFGNKKIKKNIFFHLLDFIFRRWPAYFWKQPTLYKITRFPGELLRYIFKK